MCERKDESLYEGLCEVENSGSRMEVQEGGGGGVGVDR